MTKIIDVLAFAAFLACASAAAAAPLTYHGRIVKDGRGYDVAATFTPAPLPPARASVAEGTETDEDGEAIRGYLCTTTLDFNLGTLRVEVSAEQSDEQGGTVSATATDIHYSLSRSAVRTGASCGPEDAYRFAADDHGQATVFGGRFFDGKLFVMLLNKNHLETSGAVLEAERDGSYELKGFDFEGLRKASDTPDSAYYQFADAAAGTDLEKTPLIVDGK